MLADALRNDAFFVKPYDPQQIVTWIRQRQPTNFEDSDVA
jgi:hypothetical protein